MKLAAIYSRVSTDEQTKGYSLQTQVEACQSYAKDRRYAVVDVFSDDYTGAAIDRPSLNRLRDYMYANALDVVIVYDIDRLARKAVYQMLIEEEFKKAGVTIEYVIGQYEDSDEGRLQKQFRGIIAEYEKSKFLERGKRGKRGKAKSGYVLPGARCPYGYRVISEPHKAWFEIEDDEACVVRMVFDWYLNGDEHGHIMSANAIARRLTAMGVPTRGDRHTHVRKIHGNGVWQRAMIIHILTNETYTGVWHFGKTKMIDDGRQREQKPKKGLGKQVAREKEEWIPVEVPVIIDAHTFRLAQEKKEVNRGDLRKVTEHQYLMKSRLRCTKCGYAESPHSIRHRFHYYRCKGRDQVVSLCDMPNVRADWLDALVWEWAKAIIEDPRSLKHGLDRVQQELEQQNQALIDRLQILEEQINQNQAHLDRLLDLYLDGQFPKEILTERKARLEDLLFNLGKEQNELMIHIRKVTMTDEQLAFIEAFCAKIRVGLDNADFKTRRQIIELLDIRGEIAFENGEKVIYLRCLINFPEQQPVLPMPISHSLSCHKGTQFLVTARLVLPRYKGRQEQIYENNYVSCGGRNFIIGCYESLGAGIHTIGQIYCAT